MHRPHLIVAALATVCIALALPASGFAHAGIKSYSPKPGSAVSRDLSAVRITFKARITDGNLTVKTASGTKVSRGSGRVVSKHRAMRALLKTGLKSRPLHRDRQVARHRRTRRDQVVVLPSPLNQPTNHQGVTQP